MKFMKLKSRKSIIFMSMMTTLIILISVYFIRRFVVPSLADKTWIVDLGYEENEIHNLTFDSIGYRSCPEIPIQVGNGKFKITFDTGCGAGVQFTNAIEEDSRLYVIKQN